MNSFKIKTPGTILFGIKRSKSLLNEIKRFGAKALLLSDEYSLSQQEKFQDILTMLKNYGIDLTFERLIGPSTVEVVDSICSQYYKNDFDVVVAIGAENLVNTAKVIKFVLSSHKPNISQYIKKSSGEHITGYLPLIVMPTTPSIDRTVTSKVFLEDNSEGESIKTINHNFLMPDVSIVDPSLCFDIKQEEINDSCIYTLANLIECYTSSQATSFSDLLATEGIKSISEALDILLKKEELTDGVKEHICYSSLLSGLISQNVAATVIRGLAMAVKNYYPIPLNKIMAALLCPCTLKNMQRVQFFDNHENTITKYAFLGSMLSGIEFSYDKKDVLMRAVSEYLEDITEKINVPTLSELGVSDDSLYKISSEVNQYANPVELADTELLEMLEACF